MSPCPHLVAISVFVTGFISSAATAVITIVVCLVVQKRPQQPVESVIMTTAASHGETFDDLTETAEKKEVVSFHSKGGYTSDNN